MAKLTNKMDILTDNLMNQMRDFTPGLTHEPNRDLTGNLINQIGDFTGLAYKPNTNISQEILHNRKSLIA